VILKYIFTVIITILAIAVQSHISLDVIRVFGVKPDILFIIVVYFAYAFGAFYGQMVAFVSGLIRDSISGSPLGFLTLPSVFIAFIIGMFGKEILKDNLLNVALMIFAASFVKGIISFLLSIIFLSADVFSIVSIVLPESLYNAIIAPAIFILFNKLFADEIKRSES
jgi:rod shape-determining protein MreD